MILNELNLNKVILHPDFFETIDQLKNNGISNINNPVQSDFDFSFDTFPPNGKLKLLNEKIQKLDFKSGGMIYKSGKYSFGGYDESKWDYISLEGNAYITSHSYVLVGKDDYIPVNFITNYFYTRSMTLSNKNKKLLKYSDDPNSLAKGQYATDRSDFLEQYVPENSLLFVDGPLIGGQINSITRKMVEYLHKKNIIPIFFVKNSTSNLVTDNVPELSGKYNSDMHWSSSTLNPGEITNLFLYEDQINKENAKIFTYIRPFTDTSPQRIEMHRDSYNMIKNDFINIFNLIYYLLMVHGDKRNPQIRPIAIAEKFARETLKIINLKKILRSVGLIPTMNQERGFKA